MLFLVKCSDDSQKYYYAEKADEIVQANSIEDVLPAINNISSLQKSGYTLAGWISYEASPAFDPRHKVISSGDLPLLYFMASKNVRRIELSDLQSAGTERASKNSIAPHINQQEYEKSCSDVLDFIHEGDIYQANYSFRCDLELAEDPLNLFLRLEKEHPVPYSFYLDNGDWQIVSQSPELFIKKEGRKLTSDPMKGTIHRGKSFNEDEELRLELSRDSKSRAENVMIVDLMRNDFSRICELNSVRVPKLFEATRYNSLHQLTSRVEGKVRQDISLSEIFKATFPAGSITGAPKIRSMEIITELEKDGRRLYTGSAGIFHAGGDFTLNVCIRTLVCQNRKALLGIGSGIVADSAQQLEWQECLLKSSFLNFSRNHSEIFETMLWEPENGIYLLESHLLRLKQSCLYFRTAFDELEVRLKLTELIKSFGATQRRLRLSICNDGLIKFTHSELLEDGWGKNELRVLISDKSINSNDTYLYHKTDYRQLYNESFKSARQKCFDEVIFFNEKDQLCEGAISNIFIRKANQWLTPKLSCGLLPGTWRAQMVIELKATESIISLQELLAADEVIIGNSLRRKGVVKDILSQQALKF